MSDRGWFDRLEKSLPFALSRPAGVHARRLAVGAQVAVVVAVGAMLVAPVVQIQHRMLRNRARAEAYEARRQAGALTAKDRRKGPPKPHAGAINRWRPAVRAMWAGQNIYETSEEVARRLAEDDPTVDRDELGVLHPNMPAVVIALSPFAYLPVEWGGLIFSVLKALAAAWALWAAVRVCNHDGLRMADWVVALGVAFWGLLIVSDLQHANTNGFVLAAVVLHLWLARRGRSLAAGAALAGAICLKLTPALFLLYWLWQRQWRLLRGTLATLLLVMLVLPAVLLGPARAGELTATWGKNLILPGLVEGRWYPIHTNQSLPATLGRYLLAGEPGGDLHWGSDDMPYEAVEDHAWIAPVNLGEQTVRWIIRGVQAVMMVVMAWAVGWRKLPPDDGRRGLHAAMVLSAMMLLNQRTWDHHAAVLLPALLACWYGVAFGRFGSRKLRGLVLGMLLASGLLLWASAGELVVAVGEATGMDEPAAERFRDIVDAYGPRCLSFLLLWGGAVVLAAAMRRSDPPCATQRQTLRRPEPVVCASGDG